MRKYYSQLLSLVLLGGVVAPVSSLEADRHESGESTRTVRNNQRNGKSSLDTLETFGLTSRKPQNQNSAVASGNSNTQPQKTAGATSTSSTTMGNTNPNPQKLNSIIVTGNSKAQTPASASKPSNTKIAENSNTMETIVDLLKQWNLLQAQIEARVAEIQKVDPSYSLEKYMEECGSLLIRKPDASNYVTGNDLNLLFDERNTQDKFQSAKKKFINDLKESSNKSKEQAEILLRAVTDQMQQLDSQKVRNVNCLIGIKDAISEEFPKKKKRRCNKNENDKLNNNKGDASPTDDLKNAISEVPKKKKRRCNKNENDKLNNNKGDASPTDDLKNATSEAFPRKKKHHHNKNENDKLNNNKGDASPTDDLKDHN